MKMITTDNLIWCKIGEENGAIWILLLNKITKKYYNETYQILTIIQNNWRILQWDKIINQKQIYTNICKIHKRAYVLVSNT